MSAGIGVPHQLYLQPLLHGIRDKATHFAILEDIPGSLWIKFRDQTAHLNLSFLTPIDYARYGGELRIVPGVAVSSSAATGSVMLYMNQDVKEIRTVAVDIRVTSELVLLSILLRERFKDEYGISSNPKMVAMMPDLTTMLQTADAALVVNFKPGEFDAREFYGLDLVDEWNDMTGLPYVHGMWVGRDSGVADETIVDVVASAFSGMDDLHTVSEQASRTFMVAPDLCRAYLDQFHYSLGEEEIEALEEFIRYSFYFGMIGDMPDLNFFSPHIIPAR